MWKQLQIFPSCREGKALYFTPTSYLNCNWVRSTVAAAGEKKKENRKPHLIGFSSAFGGGISRWQLSIAPGELLSEFHRQ